MAEPSMSRSSGGYSSGPERGYSSGHERGGGYTSSDGEGLTSEAKSLKRRRFEQHRKQHYNMRAALEECVPPSQHVAGCVTLQGSARSA